MTYDRPRQHSRVPVVLEVVWEGGSGQHEARMSDLSLGGCYIDTIGEATVGETINFKVRIPQGPWLHLRGEVVHHEAGMGLGLRFPEMSEGYRKILDQLISQVNSGK